MCLFSVTYFHQTDEISDEEEEDDDASSEPPPSIIDESLELPYKESYLTMKEGDTFSSSFILMAKLTFVCPCLLLKKNNRVSALFIQTLFCNAVLVNT